MAMRIHPWQPLSIGIALVLLSAGLTAGAASAAEAKKQAAPSELQSVPLPQATKQQPTKGPKPALTPQIGGVDLVARVSGPETWKAGETKSLELKARNAAKRGAVADSGPLAGIVLLTRQPPKGGAGVAGQLPDALQRKTVKFARTPAPGGVESVTASVSVPTETAPGRYHWCLLLDPKNAVAEADEGNNVACHAVEVSGAGSLAQKLGQKLTPRVGGLAAQQQGPSLAEQIERQPDLGSGPRVPLEGDAPPPILGTELRDGIGSSARPGLRESVQSADPAQQRVDRALAGAKRAPRIERFDTNAEGGDCVEPDPSRGFLNFRVVAGNDGPRIARVRVYAVETEGQRLVYDWSAPPDAHAQTAEQFDIVDDAASMEVEGYNLVVTDSTGYASNRRIPTPYDVPMRFEMQGSPYPFVRDDSGESKEILFQMVYETRNVHLWPTTRFEVEGREVRPGGGRVDEVSPEIFRYRYAMGSSLCDASDREVTIEIVAHKRHGGCGGPQDIAISRVVSSATIDEICDEYLGTEAAMESPPSPPLSSSARADLVPVIIRMDGRQLVFRVENRGTAAVTRNFDVRVTSDQRLTQNFSISEDIPAGGTSSQYDRGVDASRGAGGGATLPASRATVSVNLLRSVEEQSYSNNSAVGTPE